MYGEKIQFDGCSRGINKCLEHVAIRLLISMELVTQLAQSDRFVIVWQWGEQGLVLPFLLLFHDNRKNEALCVGATIRRKGAPRNGEVAPVAPNSQSDFDIR